MEKNNAENVMMKKYTSSEAAKLLRKLSEEYEALKRLENQCGTFTVSLDEKIEDVRPEYDFAEVQERLETLENRVRRVKHGINIFNTVTIVPGFDMTIDQMLVYIPQLSEKKRRLTTLAEQLPKERIAASSYVGRAIIEYRYANYDVAMAKVQLADVSDELSKAQTALDLVNNTVEMELPEW